MKSKRIRLVLQGLKVILSRYIEDLLIFSGLFCLVFATFQVGRIAGFYCLGGILLALGVYFTKNPIGRG